MLAKDQINEKPQKEIIFPKLKDKNTQVPNYGGT